MSEPERKREELRREMHPDDQQLARVFPEIYEKHDDSLTCGQCLYRTARGKESYCERRLFFIKDTDIACDIFELKVRSATPQRGSVLEISGATPRRTTRVEVRAFAKRFRVRKMR